MVLYCLAGLELGWKKMGKKACMERQTRWILPFMFINENCEAPAWGLEML